MLKVQYPKIIFAHTFDRSNDSYFSHPVGGRLVVDKETGMNRLGLEVFTSYNYMQEPKWLSLTISDCKEHDRFDEYYNEASYILNFMIWEYAKKHWPISTNKTKEKCPLIETKMICDCKEHPKTILTRYRLVQLRALNEIYHTEELKIAIGIDKLVGKDNNLLTENWLAMPLYNMEAKIGMLYSMVSYIQDFEDVVYR